MLIRKAPGRAGAQVVGLEVASSRDTNTTTTNARVAPSMVQGIEPLQLMMNAKGLATAEFADYTFVFH
jgi:hypothetical protein